MVPTLFTWTGGSLLTSNWSDGNNWSGGTAPTGAVIQHDVLSFPAGAGRLANVNDIVGGAFDTLHFEDNYSVSGNSLIVGDPSNDGNVLVGNSNPTAQVTLQTGLLLPSNHFFVVDAQQSSNLAIAGTVTGDATVTMLKLGTGRVELQGSNVNFFGDFNVGGGVASVENNAALGTNTTTSVSSGATLDLEAASTSSVEAIQLSGSGAGAFIKASCMPRVVWTAWPVRSRSRATPPSRATPT